MQAMRRGAPIDLNAAIDEAARMIDGAKRRIAIVSSWGSNEELAAFRRWLGEPFASFVKPDHVPLSGEVVEDDFLLRADKNPNSAAALTLFPALPAAPGLPGDAADLVLVWGEGFDFGRVPPSARTIFLNAYAQPENARVDVFIPLSIQTERGGHYTNFQGVESAFAPCFAKPGSVADAATLFETLGTRVALPA
jgi:NADH-quinone oxidoreductase subunit G